MTTSLRCATLAFAAALLACGGSESSDVSDPPGCTSSVDGGWVSILAPTTECTWATAGTVLALSGAAFVSPGWWHCCPADAGVTVSWRNAATAQTGTAFSNVDAGLLTWSHTWSAEVALSPGSNAITVTASDPSGRTGTKTLTVAVPP